MLKIKFMGAAGEVTGSSFLVTSDNGNQLLVDFGMFQGQEKIERLNYSPLSFKPSSLKGVLLTHAHLDHCGRLPLLFHGGYSGKIYMTPPTLSLIDIILTDSAGIQKEILDRAPLYDIEDVYKVLDMCQVVEYDKELVIENFTINFRDAGHILGSASIEIIDNQTSQKMVFSGDLGNTPEDIVRPTELIESADIVVMETTYGDRHHPVDDPSLILQEEINKIEKGGGVLLIPAFSVERTQEILHRLNHLKKDKKINPDTPVFLDSPMGIHTTSVFREFKDFYNNELRSHSDDPFKFEGLVVTEQSRDSREIFRALEPKVIIAGSGMMTGGRILGHAAHYLNRRDTTLLFVGYQAEGTIGRKILEGARNVWIKDKNVQVKAKTREIKSLSSHADQEKLLLWLSYIKNVKKLFLVHGEDSVRSVFQGKVKEKINILQVFLPKINEEFEV